MKRFSENDLACPPNPLPEVMDVYEDNIYLLEQRISVFMAICLMQPEGVGQDTLMFLS